MTLVLCTDMKVAQAAHFGLFLGLLRNRIKEVYRQPCATNGRDWLLTTAGTAGVRSQAASIRVANHPHFNFGITTLDITGVENGS